MESRFSTKLDGTGDTRFVSRKHPVEVSRGYRPSLLIYLWFYPASPSDQKYFETANNRFFPNRYVLL